MADLKLGVLSDGEHLAVTDAQCLRQGEKYAWIKIELHEGRNRHIRRMLAARNAAVLRLVRVAIGVLVLGDLPKGQWRMLTPQEMDRLSV